MKLLLHLRLAQVLSLVGEAPRRGVCLQTWWKVGRLRFWAQGSQLTKQPSPTQLNSAQANLVGPHFSPSIVQISRHMGLGSMRQECDQLTRVPHLLIEIRSLGYVEIQGKDRLEVWVEDGYDVAAHVEPQVPPPRRRFGQERKASVREEAPWPKAWRKPGGRLNPYRQVSQWPPKFCGHGRTRGAFTRSWTPG